jgi:hypothetical protein
MTPRDKLSDKQSACLKRLVRQVCFPLGEVPHLPTFGRPVIFETKDGIAKGHRRHSDHDQAPLGVMQTDETQISIERVIAWYA